MPTRPSLLRRVDDTGVPLLLARLALGGLFVWMGLVKIADPTNFLKLMRQYELVNVDTGYVLLNSTAVILPWVEVVCGVALLLGIAVRAAGFISAGMLAVFTPMILKRGLELYHDTGLSFCAVNFDCGCGAGVVFLCSKLAENVGLFLLALIAIASRSRWLCLGPVLARRAVSPTSTDAPPVPQPES